MQTRSKYELLKMLGFDKQLMHAWGRRSANPSQRLLVEARARDPPLLRASNLRALSGVVRLGNISMFHLVGSSIRILEHPSGGLRPVICCHLDVLFVIVQSVLPATATRASSCDAIR